MILIITSLLSVLCAPVVAQISIGGAQFPSLYDNHYDGIYYVLGKESHGGIAPLCGLISNHHNGPEDRLFKWATCAILETEHTPVVGFSRLSTTTYDGSWTRECTHTQVLTFVESWHSNGHEDRQFNFGCMHFQNTKHGSCYWSNYVNDMDRDIHFNCASDYVLAGVQSYHSNSHEDRRFNFKCCQLADA